MRGSVRRCLASPGSASSRSIDGEEALQQIEVSRPDVIPMDVQMPRIDGVTAVRHLKELGVGARVILLSVYARDERNGNMVGDIFDARNPAYDTGGLIDEIDGLRKGGRGWPSSESCLTAGYRSG